MLKGLWLWITGSLVALLAIGKALIFCKVRIKKKQATTLFGLLQSKGKSFIIRTESSFGSLPVSHEAVCLLHRIPFYFHIEERMLRAGGASTDTIALLTLPRWQVKKIISIVDNCKIEEEDIPIYILQPWDAEKIASINILEEAIIPYTEKENYEDIENEVINILRGKVKRTGVILHGSPGNGKSFLVRYFACKYKFPVYLCSLTSDFNNHSILRMFGQVRGPAIVLMEDFDSYFNKKECLLEKSRFTLDPILNVLDGVFSNTNKIIFFLTANDINKIDDSLKSRPSRFKFIKELGFPSVRIRRKIFQEMKDEDALVKGTSGLSLDQVFTVREKVLNRHTIGESIEFACTGTIKEKESKVIQIPFHKEN